MDENMIDDEMMEKFYDGMGDTAQLAEYFPGDYDFGLDPYDPVVEVAASLMETHKGPGGVLDDPEFTRAAIRAVERSLTIGTRYDIYRKLGDLEKKVPKKDRAVLRSARTALEDSSLHLLYLGLFRELFHRHVLGLLLEIQARRVNEAYHEDLDGLRPVDMAPAPVQLGLMERMIRDFGSMMRASGKTGAQNPNEEFARFQDEWMVTPLADFDGEMPLVRILREEKENARTYAQRRHFEKYLGERVNSLYLDAKDLVEEDSIDEARRRLDAVLRLEPGHPFAAALRRRIGSGSLGGKESEELPPRTARTDYLKPVASDVILRSRRGFKEALEKELAVLGKRECRAPSLMTRPSR